MYKITKRADGRFESQVNCGYDEFGKRKRKTIYGKNKREVEKNVREFKNSLERGEVSALKPITFEQMGNMWFEKYTSDLAETTIQRYKSVFNKQLIPIHNCKINKIDTNTVQVLLNSIAAEGYSTTVKLSKVVMTKIFKRAVIAKYITSNPVRDAIMPKYEENTRRALTSNEMLAISKAEFSLKEKAYIYIGLYAGLRQGEILALTTKDIDLENEIISVNKTLTFSQNQAKIKDGTKTKNGIRNIPITEPLISVLKEYMRLIKNDGFLFIQKDGNVYSKTAKKNLWEQILKKINKHLPCGCETNITTHYLRHNYATDLYKAGVGVKEAQYLLGHSNIKTTLDIYTELDKQNIDTSPLKEFWKNRT